MPCMSASELIAQYGENWQNFVTINSGPHMFASDCSCCGGNTGCCRYSTTTSDIISVDDSFYVECFYLNPSWGTRCGGAGYGDQFNGAYTYSDCINDPGNVVCVITRDAICPPDPEPEECSSNYPACNIANAPGGCSYLCTNVTYRNNTQDTVFLTSSQGVNCCSGVCRGSDRIDPNCPCACYLVAGFRVQDGLYTDPNLTYTNQHSMLRSWPSTHSGPAEVDGVQYPQTPVGVYNAWQASLIPFPGQSFLDENGNPTMSTPHGPPLGNPCGAVGAYGYNEGPPSSDPCGDNPNSTPCGAYYTCGIYSFQCDCSTTDIPALGSSNWPGSGTPDYFFVDPMPGACCVNGVLTYGKLCGFCNGNGGCGVSSFYC